MSVHVALVIDPGGDDIWFGARLSGKRFARQPLWLSPSIFFPPLLWGRRGLTTSCRLTPPVTELQSEPPTLSGKTTWKKCLYCYTATTYTLYTIYTMSTAKQHRTIWAPGAAMPLMHLNVTLGWKSSTSTHNTPATISALTIRPASCSRPVFQCFFLHNLLSQYELHDNAKKSLFLR